MKLTYRGQSYQPTHVIAESDTETKLTYRGQSYQRDLLAFDVTSKIKLVYRGVTYSSSDIDRFRFSQLTPVFN